MHAAATNFQHVLAPLSALAFLGAGAFTLLLALVAGFLFVTGRRRWAIRALAGIPVLFGLYLVTLIGFSLDSRELVLARGQEKVFCELDCHLAYSVQDVRRAPVLGDSLTGTRARGTFWVVDLRTRFDRDTISPRRPMGATLRPNPRAVAVVDASGRRYAPSAAAARILDREEGPSTPIDTPLRPGESYVTRLVFDLPAGIRDPRLLVTEAGFPVQFLIGDETSILHRKAWFSLAG